MNQVLFVQYPKCSTCQKASKWLTENNISFDSRNITTENPTAEELKKWISLSGLPISKFFNTSGKLYKEGNLKDKVKIETAEQLIDLLSSNGMLVKRPIIVTDQFVLVGFKDDQWKEKLLVKA